MIYAGADTPYSLPLMTTRLVPPRIPEGGLKRERLLQQLFNDRQGGGLLYVVTAPAGYGKSTLLAQCCSRCQSEGKTSAWLTLDDDDNDEESFYCYLRAAFEQLIRDIPSKSAEGLLGRGASIGGRALISELVRVLSSSDASYALFLDDYHLITEPKISAAVQYLVKYLPPNLSLFIGSRTPLPIPLAKLRASNLLVSLEAADLRFDRGEAKQLFQETNQLDVSSEDMDLLYERTGGWAAVLQLAALSLKGVEDRTAFVRNFSGSSEPVSDFLAEEVVELMPREMAEFLIRTSIAERLCPPLCQAISGDVALSSRLERLSDIRFLMQGLDDKCYWFRLHPLFRNFLLKQLEMNFPQEKSELHSSASLWFEEQGLMAEAIEHAISGGDERRALELLEEHGILLLTQGYMERFFSLVRRLPESLLHRSHEILVQLAWWQVLTNHIPQAQRLLEELKQPLKDGEGLAQETWVEVQTIEAALYFLADNYTAAKPLVEEWLPKAPDEPPYIASALRVIQTYSHFNEFNYEEALQESRWVLNLPESPSVAYVKSYSAGAQALVCYARGQLKQGAAGLSADIERLRQCVGSNSQVVTLLEPILAAIYYQSGELELSEPLFDRGLDSLRVQASADIVILALRTGMGLLYATGQHQRALELLSEGQGLAKQRGWIRVEACVMHERVRLYIGLGERDQAAVEFDNWSRRRKRLASVRVPQLEQSDELSKIAEARLAIAEGDDVKAAVILKALLEQTTFQQRVLLSMELWVLLARAYAESGKLEQAKQSLQEALKLDRENCVIQLFRDEGEALVTVLQALRQDMNSASSNAIHMLRRQQLDRILVSAVAEKETLVKKKSSGPASPAGEYTEMIENLTKRELSSLKLLAEGMSNKEISEQLFVSPNTVKKHLISAYAKLGVSRRTQAVRRLKELGVLG